MALIENLRAENPPENDFADAAQRQVALLAASALMEAVKSKTDDEYRRAITYAAHQVERLHRELLDQPLVEVTTKARHVEFVELYDGRKK